MDHETAIRIQAAERYVLEEFPPEERAAFEEHFFECPACAEEVRSATIFAANAKAVLRDERAREQAKLERAAERPGRRFAWLLAASAALNVALVAGLGLEWMQFRRAAEGIEPQFYSTFVVTAGSRGSQPAAVLPAGIRFFGVRFDLTPGEQFESFEYRILDAKRSVRSAGTLAAPFSGSSELQLAIPVVPLEAGEYTLVLAGKQAGSSKEIGRRNFSISR